VGGIVFLLNISFHGKYGIRLEIWYSIGNLSFHVILILIFPGRQYRSRLSSTGTSPPDWQCERSTDFRPWIPGKQLRRMKWITVIMVCQPANGHLQILEIGS
jgi:hypothetical protein